LRKIAKVAGPMIATAVGGPAAGAAARLLTRQLEGEFEDEMEAELEEMATAPITPTQAYAEYLAAKAATSESESEAEAFAGSAITISLTPRDRRRLGSHPAAVPQSRQPAGRATGARHRCLSRTDPRPASGGRRRPACRRRSGAQWCDTQGADGPALAGGCGPPSRARPGASPSPPPSQPVRPSAIRWPQPDHQAAPCARPRRIAKRPRHPAQARLRAGGDPGACPASRRPSRTGRSSGQRCQGAAGRCPRRPSRKFGRHAPLTKLRSRR
jgi:hypothetical protein